MLSLLIACVELLFLINLLIFSDKNKLNRIAKILIFILMLYQLLEFTICRTVPNNSWIIYITFSIISFLPPLALLFILNLRGFQNKYIKLIFIPPVFFTVLYFFNINIFQLIECTSLYTIYKYPYGDLYGFFYYVPVILSIVLLIKELLKNKNSKLIVLLIGFIVMCFPVIFAFILKFIGNGWMVSTIVSVMCKSAFFFAFSLFYFALHNKSVKENV